MGNIIETIFIMLVLLAGLVTFLAVCVAIANHGMRFLRERRGR